MNRMTIYDRFGNWIDDLTNIISATWTQKVNALSTLEIETYQELSKGQRLVWRDDLGTWHEHVVVSVDYEHSGGSTPVCSVYLEDSLNELRGDYIEDKRPGVSVSGGVSATTALEAALENSRWKIGTVSVTTYGGLSMYHESAWDALCDIIDVWGGEIESVVTVSNTEGVTSRSINLLARVGSDTVTRRFEWSHDLSDIKRSVDDSDVITAAYAWGKGEEIEETGGYGRRIGISDVTSDGLPYVHDDSLLPIWGRPDGSGGYAHVFGEYLATDCDDPEELLAGAEAFLEENSEPLVSYSASVVQLARAGFDAGGVALGDSVHIVDDALGVRLEGRVMGIKTDLLNPENPTLTLGNFIPGMDDMYTSIQSTLGGITDRSANYDAASSASATYIAAVVDELNDLFAASGAFVTFDFAEGLTFTDKATYEESTSAINICGAGFRISSSKNASGGWNWSTFGTGYGFVSDLIIAGTLRAGRIEDVLGDSWWDLDNSTLSFKNGRIQSADGSSYWDFTSGEMDLTVVDQVNTNLSSQITQTANEINQTITDTANNLQSQITQTESSIMSTVSDTYATKSELTQTSSSLTSTITDVQNNLQSQITQTASDLTVAINSAQSDIDDLSTLIRFDSNGVTVGRSTNGGSSYTTARTRVGSDGTFSILDASGTAMATYGANTINLGTSTDYSTIYLSNGSYIYYHEGEALRIWGVNVESMSMRSQDATHVYVECYTGSGGSSSYRMGELACGRGTLELLASYGTYTPVDIYLDATSGANDIRVQASTLTIVNTSTNVSRSFSITALINALSAYS